MKKRLVSVNHHAKKSCKTLVLSLATILVFTGCAAAEPGPAKSIAGERSNAVSIGTVTDKVTVPVKETERVIYENNQVLKIEVLSYDLIDDTDISKQTKYDAKYFVEGKVPDSDYVYHYTDYQAMMRDYPKYAEYIESYGEKGMTEEEAEKFEKENKAKYAASKHLRTKYLFIRCKITYLGGAPKVQDLRSIRMIAMNGDKMTGFEFFNCYFDHSQHLDSADKTVDFFDYEFKTKGDSIECVLGSRLSEDQIDLSKDAKYYIGTDPSEYYPENTTSFPKLYSGMQVALADLPKM